MEKFLSRKFLISAAAFCVGLGTLLPGVATGNTALAITGGVLVAFGTALYDACEAYVDGQSARANQTVETKTETKTVTATSNDRDTVKQAIAPVAPTETE